jgi:hypothetical protein
MPEAPVSLHGVDSNNFTLYVTKEDVAFDRLEVGFVSDGSNPEPR